MLMVVRLGLEEGEGGMVGEAIGVADVAQHGVSVAVAGDFYGFIKACACTGSGGYETSA